MPGACTWTWTLLVLFSCICLHMTLTSATPMPLPTTTMDQNRSIEDDDAKTKTKKVPGFSRDCSSSSVYDCVYRNSLVKSTAYLRCGPDKVCACENDWGIADVPAWKVEWNGTACHIAESGPCGPDKGNELVMHCQTGLECVQGRCRDPSKLRQAPLWRWCSEDIDCVDGLVCKVMGFSYGPYSNCVSPETPALKGFE